MDNMRFAMSNPARPTNSNAGIRTRAHKKISCTNVASKFKTHATNTIETINKLPNLGEGRLFATIVTPFLQIVGRVVFMTERVQGRAPRLWAIFRCMVNPTEIELHCALVKVDISGV
jgi:hypothetical protein